MAEVNVNPPVPEFMDLSPETGPNGNPINPQQGEAPPDQDSNFIMDTLFGQDTNSSARQEPGQSAPDGASSGSVSAPPSAAPAANGGEVSPATPGASPTAQPVPAGTPAVEAPPQTPAPGTQPAAEATPPADTLTVEQRLALASLDGLKRQNAELLQRLEARDKPGTQPNGQAPAAPANQSEQPQEQVSLTVPQPLLEALNSDDPAVFGQGLNVLVSAVATNAVNIALAKSRELIDRRFTEINQISEQARAIQSQEEQYFSAFPAHNNELYRPLIAQTTKKLYDEFPHLTWDQHAINAVGARVNKKLEELGIPVGMVPANPAPAPSGQAPAITPAVPAPRAQPAAMLDTSTRAAPVAESEDFISATFS